MRHDISLFLTDAEEKALAELTAIYNAYLLQNGRSTATADQALQFALNIGTTHIIRQIDFLKTNLLEQRG